MLGIFLIIVLLILPVPSQGSIVGELPPQKSPPSPRLRVFAAPQKQSRIGGGSATKLHVTEAFSGIDRDTFTADTIRPICREREIITQPLDLAPQHAMVPNSAGPTALVLVEKMAMNIHANLQ